MSNRESQIERERRWVVKKFDPLFLGRATEVQQIVQGYFDVLEDQSFRVRIIDDERAIVNLKTGTGEVRKEEEESASLRLARIMLSATSFRVEKTRHVIDGWELDVFKGPLAGIVILEYEAHGDEPIPPLPSWIHDAIDVTDSLTNLHLARMAKEISGDVNEHVSRYLEPRLPKIVLTGGPCSGKSTLMREVIEKYGDRVHCVPEVASILIAQVGILPSATDEKHNARFQQILYRVQRSFEEAAELQAMKDGKQAIVLDRGTVDAVAYLHGEDNLKRQAHFTIATGLSVRAELNRYAQVICLAPPTRDVFETHRTNNPARSETYEQAVELGRRSHAAWHVTGYPEWNYVHFKQVDGKTWVAKRDAAFKILDFYIDR
ncbi:MAG: AAA family ATPase [Candidatus Uhrbacteria bacterium]|nr:AAA family ATPase [Candidatus Uhrbacteria bacterium]